MFPLTDLSILFTALLIIAAICLGLLVLLGMLISKRFNGSNPPPNPQPVNPQNNAPQPPNQLQDVIEKLDGVKKDIVLGTNAAIFGLAFAFAVFSTQIIFRNVLQGLIGIVLSFIMLEFGYPKNRKWIHENYKRFSWLFYSIIIILLIISFLSIRFIYIIPT